jgi:hypothetical protein
MADQVEFLARVNREILPDYVALMPESFEHAAAHNT